jgi:hypothetical protein
VICKKADHVDSLKVILLTLPIWWEFFMFKSSRARLIKAATAHLSLGQQALLQSARPKFFPAPHAQENGIPY